MIYKNCGVQVIPGIKSYQTRFKRNVQVLNQLLKYEFKRKLKPDNAVGMPEIHGFCDAGEKAYGSAMFLRWKLDDGSYTCVQLLVKAFVLSLKKKSIPRLELMSCLALSSLYRTCREALEFAEISSCKKVFWIDSQVVLSWLKTSPRKFKPFVSVRVAEIQETIDPQEFSYIRSEHNPADFLTKGILPEQLEKWSQGPQFLRKPQKEWPKFEEKELKINEELSAEMKPPIEARPTSCDKAEFSTAQKELRDNPLFEHLMKTCSTFSKARKTLAYVLRFVNNTRMKTKNGDPISPKELTESELQLFKWCQQTIEVYKLDKKLIPSKDERGLLREHGRLENIRTLPDEMRSPIILPKSHRLVELLLDHLNGKRTHCGYKSLIYESRKRFRIVGVRHMAKHLTGKCVTCKKLRKKPVNGIGLVRKAKIKTATSVYDRPIHKLCLIATKEELNSMS